MIHSGITTVSVLKHKSYLDFAYHQDRGSKLLRSQNLESRTDSHCLVFGTLSQTWDSVRHCGPTREHDNVTPVTVSISDVTRVKSTMTFYLKVINI